MMNIEKHFVKIKTIGNGYGESILINISNYIFLGIDSSKCLSKSFKKYESVVNSFISEREEHSKVYWIISHYHYDHFQNFIHVYENLLPTVEKILFPSDYTNIDYNHMLKMPSEVKSRLLDREIQYAFNEYEKLRNLQSKLGMRSSAIGNGNLNLVSIDLTDENGLTKHLKISVFAPSIGEANKIRKLSLKKFKNDNLSQNVSGKLVNATSYITYIEYGNFQASFFADAPINRIQTFLNHIGNAQLDFAKISHHGSPTGSTKAIVKLIKSNKAQYAFVTPYTISKLPVRKVLKLYKKRKFKVSSSLKANANSEFKKEWEQKLSIIPGEIRVLNAVRENENMVSIHYNSSYL